MPRNSWRDDDEENYDFLFKVVVIGDSMVGKTSLLERFRDGTFNEHHSCTIGVDFIVKTLQVDTKRVKLHIWDTAGQERFRAIARSYYQSARGVIITYDISQEDTYQNVKQWLTDVKEICTQEVACILVGNKSDLELKRKVKKEEAEQFAEMNAIPAGVVETSAKDGTNVEHLFRKLARQLMILHGMDFDEECEAPGVDRVALSDAPGNGNAFSIGPTQSLDNSRICSC